MNVIERMTKTVKRSIPEIIRFVVITAIVVGSIWYAVEYGIDFYGNYQF